ncbi:hypothetical protein LCGC14_2734820, partial [marine sediment metagenome]
YLLLDNIDTFQKFIDQRARTLIKNYFILRYAISY